MRRGLVVSCLVGLALASVGAASIRAAARPHVTLITDSVGGALGWDPAAAEVFGRGFDADLELKGCRRLTTAGCTLPGLPTPPESALETITRLGRALGPNVIVDVGYNDYPTVYAPGIEQVLRALAAAGVQHVFWVTLHGSRGVYGETNAAIRAAAARHRELTVIDWDACATGHDDWFGPDAVHLTSAGAEGLASCLHDAVVRTLAAEPPPLDVGLAFPPGLAPGFHARLVASGGTAPYRFHVRGLPRGLHVTETGRIAGSYVRSGRFTLRVSIRDARGRRAVVSLPLDVSP